MLLTVATITSAHGLKGEVKVAVRTDEPERRLAVGNTLETSPPDAGPLTIRAVRRVDQRWFVRFEQATDRNQAEALRGVELVIESDEEESDDEAWYPHELIGLQVIDDDGATVGTLEAITHSPAHDLLQVRETVGELTPIPFVAEIVPTVDPVAGHIIITPPGGLLARDNQGAAGEQDAGEQPEERA